MQDKIITTFGILDDLLQALHHRDDPQAKASDSEIPTIATLAPCPLPLDKGGEGGFHTARREKVPL